MGQEQDAKETMAAIEAKRKESEDRKADVLDKLNAGYTTVDCPTCKAPAGDPCKGLNDGVSHLMRRIASARRVL